VRKTTENDAKSQRVLLNLGTYSKNKKREEEEHNIGCTTKTKVIHRAGGMNDSQAAYLKP
jgi:hypothetical protein